MTWTQSYPITIDNTITKRALSTFALVLVGFTSCSTPTQAKQYGNPLTPVVDPANGRLNNSHLVQRPLLHSRLPVRFIPPPYVGAPSGRRRGGATRCPKCKNNDWRLTALVPGNGSKSFLALTTAEHPTFWFYIPNALTPSRPVEFVLQDDKDNYIYTTSFTAPGRPPGVVSLSLPQEVAPLEIGKQYRWTFIVKDPSSRVFVNGSVQRVALNPTLRSQLKAGTPLERTVLYATNGIWQEALTTLAELRRTNPQDVTLNADWNNLLHSVGLDDIATEPIHRSILHSEATTAIK